MSKYTFLCFLLYIVSAGLRADIVGVESPAEANSLAPSLVGLNDGSAILTWLERVDDGHVLKFSRYDGNAFGPAREIARGSDWFANWADTPGLFVLPDGAWLAHWLDKSGPATYAYDVVMAVSHDQGATWSEPFSPHDDRTPTEHGFVSYFAWSPTQAGVVWLDGRETGGGGHHGGDHGHHGDMTLRTAAVNVEGGITDPALLDDRVCDCCQTAAAMTEDGPVVIYRGRSADEIRDIRIVRHEDGGWTEPASLHDDGWEIAGCPVNGPALIGRDRELVAAWFTMADGEPRVKVTRSEDAGRTFSPPLVLGRGDALGRVDLVWLNDGFALSWLEGQGRNASVEVAGFGDGTELRWRQSLPAVESGRVSGFPRLLNLDDASLLIAWTAPDPHGRPRVQVGRFHPVVSTSPP